VFGLAEVLGDETWCNKVSFLADISQGLNTLNKIMQAKIGNMLTCTDNPWEPECEKKIKFLRIVKLRSRCRLEKKNM
jgi:hypothetical protein